MIYEHNRGLQHFPVALLEEKKSFRELASTDTHVINDSKFEPLVVAFRNQKSSVSILKVAKLVEDPITISTPLGRKI